MTTERGAAQGTTESDYILEVEDLKVQYSTPLGPVRAVDGISFALKRGEKLGLVGESGCGKSTTAFAIMRLIAPPGRVVSGQIRIEGRDVLAMVGDELRQMRFAEVALVPQGAMNALNPVMKVREQIADTITAHSEKPARRVLDDRVAELLLSVDLQPDVARLYPHELSGGMKQRVCLAMATALRPSIIIADEPTSALDVVVQRQVFDTLARVQQELNAAVILVGHDMGLMAQFVDRVGVMYAGKMVELAPTEEFFNAPLHPYAQLLVESLPSLDQRGALTGIGGLTPSLRSPPQGCMFHPRCPRSMPECSVDIPEFREVRLAHRVACLLYDEVGT